MRSAGPVFCLNFGGSFAACGRRALLSSFCRARRPRRAVWQGVPPCGAGSFPSDGKGTKGSPGDAAEANFVRQWRLTPGPPITGAIPWARQKISGAQNLSDTLNSRRATGPFVVAKSARLRFRLTAKTALAPLLLLSNANPLRWALRWEPPSAAYWVENCRWCGSAAAPGFAEPTCPVQHMGYLICPLRGHLPLKGKALEGPSPCLPL